MYIVSHARENIQNCLSEYAFAWEELDFHKYVTKVPVV